MATPDAPLIPRIHRIHTRLVSLKTRLDNLGYIFDRADDILPGPRADTERILNRIEEAVGPVPGCIAMFWREIGSVDFCGHHSDWCGCE